MHLEANQINKKPHKKPRGPRQAQNVRCIVALHTVSPGATVNITKHRYSYNSEVHPQFAAACTNVFSQRLPHRKLNDISTGVHLHTTPSHTTPSHTTPSQHLCCITAGASR
jgi:hypothetical protein